MGQLKGSCDEAASSKADESAMDSILARRVADRQVTLARKSPMQVSIGGVLDFLGMTSYLHAFFVS